MKEYVTLKFIENSSYFQGLEIGDYILKSEAGLIFYRQELP